MHTQHVSCFYKTVYSEGANAFATEHEKVKKDHLIDNWQASRHKYESILAEGGDTHSVIVKNPYPVQTSANIVWKAGFDDQKHLVC